MARAIIIVLALCVVISAATAYAGITGEEHIGWFPMHSERTCEGSIGECLAEEEEYGMSSEISRRILAGEQKYISYGAMNKNTVPCSLKGQPYYSNCKPGAKANQYTPDCTAINKCRK